MLSVSKRSSLLWQDRNSPVSPSGFLPDPSTGGELVPDGWVVESDMVECVLLVDLQMQCGREEERRELEDHLKP